MIDSLYIRNFRSIKELEIQPGNLCALVGANSAGKTNILHAIDLVLGEKWTTKNKVSRELFNDENEPIEIVITFKTPIEWFNSYKSTTQHIDAVSLTMSYSISQQEASSRLWEGGYRTGANFALNEQFKNSCHFVYLPSMRNLQDELRVSSWTMLGKLMKLVHDNYLSHYEGNATSLKNDFKKKIKEAKDFLEDDFDMDKVTFKRFTETLAEFCKINSSGMANSFSPELNIYNLNWFYKTLQITVKELTQDGKDFDVEEVGSGMQNLIFISIFETYAKLLEGKAILAIEEPEIYLYPQAQRQLYKNFQDLSRNTQIFYTTHNPYFVSASRAYEVEIVKKTEDVGTYLLKKDTNYLNETNANKEKFKIYTHFNTERNELFFAKKVLLVEGASDKILFSTLAEEKWGISLDKNGISIIECGGKTGVIYFIGVCLLMGMDNFFSIWDSDEEVDDTYSLLSKVIEQDIGLEIPGNLEKFLHLSSNSSAKVEQAYKWALTATKIPDEFSKVKDFLSKI